MTNQQQNLFDCEPEPWEADDQAEQWVASVVLPTGPTQEFDYSVPDGLRDRIEPGRRVKVPLGRSNRLVLAYCVRLEFRPPGTHALKPIGEVVDQRRLLSAAMLQLTRWIADYYLCPWGQVLETVVPAGVRMQAGTKLVTLLNLSQQGAERLAAGDLPAKQLAVLKALSASEEPVTPNDLAVLAQCTTAPITTLRRKGFIAARTERISTEPTLGPRTAREEQFVLNNDQQRALTAILAALRGQRYETLLIHGVTGSGKTEVYIQAIDEVVSYGRQAIVLVPEISLTPQTVDRFRKRFGRVAVLHSHQTDSERHWHWQRIADGQVSVVVGARSAIFAPVPQLGLIVLDEEHENSFKQSESPRYHARDVAIERAKAEKVPLVLGSATPSLESWARAKRGEFRLLEMPCRVMGRPLPEVGTIDLRADTQRGSRGAISRQLALAMQTALADNGQVMLLLNRRGYSTHIQCPECGKVVSCPDCDIALTHHRGTEIALCHYCDYQVPAPSRCPECDSPQIRYGGLGTQRLEAEIRTRFPKANCLRMDTDTMRTRGAHEAALAEFRAGKVQILLGTQMIAKGLDFPNVTLVGVIQADTALHLPDFRAAERTFHLVTQVAGRTGRGDRGGRVLVQTSSPDHPAILAAMRHDYAAFAEYELPLRELLHYPPFAAMLRIVIRGPSEKVTLEFAKQLAERLKEHLDAAKAMARVLGPAPAPFARLRGLFRFQIHMQGRDGEKLRTAVREVGEKLQAPTDVLWIADVDPLDMM